jgi:hypothetical protein
LFFRPIRQFAAARRDSGLPKLTAGIARRHSVTFRSITRVLRLLILNRSTGVFDSFVTANRLLYRQAGASTVQKVVIRWFCQPLDF